MLTIIVGEESFELSDAEVKGAEVGCISIREYVENTIRDLARRSMADIVTEFSDKQPGKIGKIEAESIVMTADIKSAEEKQLESEGELERVKQYVKSN